MNIRRIDPGSAFSVEILKENHELETFRLALLKDSRWEWELGDHDYRLIFVNDKGQFFEGMYSGGSTGAGVHPRDIRELSQQPKYEVLTTNPKEILRMTEELVSNYENKTAQEEAERKAGYERIKKAIRDGEPREVYNSDKYVVTLEPSLNKGGGLSIYGAYTFKKASVPTRHNFAVQYLFTPSGRISKAHVTGLFSAEGKDIALAVADGIKQINAEAKEARKATNGNSSSPA
jgi:hypothetical protein